VAGACLPAHQHAGRPEADDGPGGRGAHRVRQHGQHRQAVRERACQEQGQARSGEVMVFLVEQNSKLYTYLRMFITVLVVNTVPTFAGSS